MSSLSNPTFGVGTTPYQGGGQVTNPMNVIPYVGVPTFKAPLPAMTIDHTNGVFYVETSPGTWVSGGSAGGPINTINGLSPSAGNIVLAGTASQITATSAGHTVTFSIPSAFIAPGSIASTTTITSGTSLAVTTSATVGTTLGVTGTSTMAAINASGAVTLASTLGVTGTSTLGALTQVGTASINASGAGVTTIGTGGTGAVNIGNATGNTAVTGSLTASTGLVATTGGITASAGGAAITGTTTINNSGAGTTTIGTGGTGFVHIGNATGNTAVTGSLTATTTLTATLGNITATNGNLNLAHAGNKLLIHASTAASDAIGVTAAMTAGSIVVSTSAVTASSIIFLTAVTPGGTQGVLSYGTIVAGVSFTITSSNNADTSTVAYLIIN